MANLRYRSQFSYSFAGQPVSIMAQVNFGASGAPTIASSTGMGIQSIVRNSAGNYTITLTNSFAMLLDVSARFISGASAPAAPAMNIVANSITSGVVQIQFRDIAGAAADPASGESALLVIQADRSSMGH